MDFAKLMPPDNYFVGSRKYEHNGSFAFERFGKMASAREVKPIMDFTFTVEIQEVNWRQGRQTDQEQAHLDQEEQSHQMMSSQLDLNAVGNEAIIHEVPNDRIVEKPVQWEHVSEDKISVASLDVGAELSNSDPEQDTATEMSLSDSHESDYSETGSKCIERRKKFTRLMEPRCESKVLTMIQEVSTDVEEENITDCIKNSKKSLKRSVKEATEIVNSKLNSVKSMDRLELHKLKLENMTEKVLQNDLLATDFRPNTIIKELKSNDVSQNFDIVNETDKNNPFPLNLGGKNAIKLNNNEQKNGTLETKFLASKPNADNTNEIRTLDEIKNVCSNEIPKQHFKTNVLIAQHEDMKKKKKSSGKTEEIDTLPVKKMEKPSRKLMITKQDDCDGHLNSIDENYAYLKTKRQSLRRKVTENHSHAMEQESGIEKEQLNVNKYNNQIHKTEKILTNSKIDEKLSSKESKAVLLEKSELSLSARWVEINKKQIKLLEETERFIGNFVDNDKLIKGETDREEKCAPSVVNKKTIQDVLFEQESSAIDSQECHLNPQKSFQIVPGHEKTFEECSVSCCEKRHKRSFRPLVEDSIKYGAIIMERSVKKKSSRKSANQSALQEADTNEMDVALQSKNNKNKQINEIKDVTKPNFDLEAETSHLEVVVHMFDNLKSTKEIAESVKINTNCLDQSVNTELDESTQKKVMAAMQLQDDMKQKSLKYIQSLRQQNENLTAYGKESQESLKDSSSTEVNYLLKFQELEQHISLLEDHLHQIENRTREMQEENFNLSNEKLQLKKRIRCMEQQIKQLRDQKSPDNRVEVLLDELRQQYASFNDVVKAKEHYKKQWRHAARRIHALKLAMYEKNVGENNNPR